MQLTVDDNVDSTQGVDQLYKAGKVHEGVIVYPDAQVVLQRGLDQSQPSARVPHALTVEVGRVDAELDFPIRQVTLTQHYITI